MPRVKTLDKMIEGAKKFDATKVKAQDIALAPDTRGIELVR